MEREKTSREVDRLKKWCEGKPIILGLVSTQIAMALEPTYEIMQECRDEAGIFSCERAGTRSQRLAYYTDHRRLRREFLLAFGAYESDVGGIEAFLTSLSWLSRADKQLVTSELERVTEKEWKNALADSKAVVEEFWEFHWSSFHDDFDDLNIVDRKLFFLNPAVQHFFLVAFPCLILHGKWPGHLLRLATQRKPNSLWALRAIIQLDKESIHLPQLHAVLHPRQTSLRSSRRILMAKAVISKTPAINRTGLRYRFARLISDISIALGCPLKTPEVRELFVIAATAYGPDRRANRKPIQPGAFMKGVNREKGQWDLGLKVDKNSSKAVRAFRARLS
jgi:hypothetical protein